MTSSVDSRLDLTGKVAVVTGASSGLGRHFAKVLTRSGASVAVAARREDRLLDLVEELNSIGGRAVAVPMDIADVSNLEACLDGIEEKLGPVDILINNAGISGEPYSWRDTTLNGWSSVMDTNLNGLWVLTQLFCRRQEASGREGVIVNVASIYGLREGLLKLPYNVSKAAVVQLTKTLAAELSQQKLPIRVNALCPGYFGTPITDVISESENGRRYIEGTPAGRMGNYEELDGALLLLTSEAGSFIHGSCLVVDGGHSVKPV